jgi:hypothetical protein
VGLGSTLHGERDILAQPSSRRSLGQAHQVDAHHAGEQARWPVTPTRTVISVRRCPLRVRHTLTGHTHSTRSQPPENAVSTSWHSAATPIQIRALIDQTWRSARSQNEGSLPGG